MVSKMCADKVFLLVLFYIDTLKRVAMTLKESSPFSLWSHHHHHHHHHQV